MSKTPVVGSVDVKVRVESHLSKVPFTATDAFTANLMELPSVVILKTGTWARLNDGNTADARRQRTANRTVLGVSLSDTKFLLWVAKRQPSESPNNARLSRVSSSRLWAAPRELAKPIGDRMGGCEALFAYRIQIQSTTSS